MPLTVRLPALVTGPRALAAAALPLALLAGCGGGGDGPAGRGGAPAAAGATGHVGRPYVLVSGRDDHGLVELGSVPVFDAPVHGVRVGAVTDGTLARVLEVRGTWLKVAPVSGGAPPGWVDDYRLRGTVHLVGPAPSCRVALAGRRQPAGVQAEVLAVRGGRATVRLLARPAVTGAVPLRYVRELPPSPDDPCPRR